MRVISHSAARTLRDRIWQHWHAWTGKHYGKQKWCLVVVLLLVTGCGWDITRPPRSCYWKHTAFATRADTIYNTVPGGSPPFVIVLHSVPTDSVRVCP